MNLAIQKLNGVSPHLLTSNCRIGPGVSRQRLRRAIRKNTAKIRDGLGSLPPAFCWNDMCHVRPSIKGRLKSSDRNWPAGPADFLQILSKPDLKSLRCDRLHVVDHRLPSCIAGDDLLADVWNFPNAYSKHDEIKIL